MRARREEDLYAPVRDFLVTQGYTVRGEVKGCDVAAEKDGELVVVELKLRLNLELLLQASERLRLTDAVYVAVPRPNAQGRTTRWPALKRLLKRLAIGLIFVNLDRAPAQPEVIFHPIPYQPQRTKKARGTILREITSRTGDHNQGGTNRRKQITAYRENAIFIACALEYLGTASPAALRELGTGPKTQPILASNFYGWFERVAKGLYTLKPAGRTALTEFADVAEHYRRQLKAGAS